MRLRTARPTAYGAGPRRRATFSARTRIDAGDSSAGVRRFGTADIEAPRPTGPGLPQRGRSGY